MRDECEHGSLRRSCRVCELEAECQEQARLLGMSAERELALRAELAEAKADAERWRRWLPWMRNLNRKPFRLAMEIDHIDSMAQSKEK